jgi:hypothetical protein
MTNRASPNGPAEERHPGAENHGYRGTFFQDANEPWNDAERRREVGVPIPDGKGVILESSVDPGAHGFSLPHILLDPQIAVARGQSRNEPFEDGGRTIAAAIVDENEPR